MGRRESSRVVLEARRLASMGNARGLVGRLASSNVAIELYICFQLEMNMQMKQTDIDTL